MMRKFRQKLDAPQFLMIVHGPSCAGKSTTVEYIMDHYEGLFRAWRDRLKWMISDYDRERHREVTAEMLLAVIEVALGNKFSVIQDQGITKGYEDRYQKLADKYNLRFIEVNIEASFETVSKRFEKRIEAAKQGAKISMTDPEVMKERYERYLVERNHELPTIHTDHKTPEEAALELLSLINETG